MTERSLFTCAAAFAVGCASDPILEDDSPTIERPMQAEAREVIEQPGPSSRLVEDVAVPRRTPRDAVQARLALVPRSERVIVAGRVTSLRAERRTLRHAEASITTRATIAVAESVCGERVGATVDVVYAGGRIGGDAEYTSQMPGDLALGTSHVFVLRRVAGELVLEMGTEDLVRDRTITTADLKEACR